MSADPAESGGQDLDRVRGIIEELRRRGHSVVVSYSEGPGPSLRVYAAGGGKISSELSSYLRRHRRAIIEALQQEASEQYDCLVEEAMARVEAALEGVPLDELPGAGEDAPGGGRAEG